MRWSQLSLGWRAEQRLHGLLPTHSEGDQDGSRSPQSKTTGRTLEHQRGHPGTLAQRGIGPNFLKLCGRVLYRQVDIEAYEESCLATSTKTVATQVSAG